MGEEANRATYVSEERTIFINLDHPQVKNARGAAVVDDPLFRRLAYEVAFTEYALALTSELANRDEFPDAQEALYEVRAIMNRVARKSASLYAT